MSQGSSKRQSKGNSNHPMDMEVDEKVDEECKEVDFESGIDSWTIGKEDSNGSSSSSLWFREASKSSTKQENIMNKENVKQKTCETERNHLRRFRKTKNAVDTEFSSGFDYETNPVPSIEETSNTSFTSVETNRLIDKESLSSEEISSMLKEIEGSSESEGEYRRSRLQSIENVALSDFNETDRNKSSFSLSFNCTFCKINFQCLEELKLHERKHRSNSSRPTGHQKAQTEYKSICESPNIFDSVKSCTTNEKNKLDNLVTMRNDVIANLSKRPKGLKCKLCNHYSNDPLAYKLHLILIHSEKNKLLDCDYCNYRTTLSSNLAKHIAVHFQLNCPYPQCDYKYTSKALCDSHLLTSHRPNETFKCQKCDYVCMTNKKLKRHAQKHAVTSKYKCRDCSLNFGNKETLRVHLKTHELSKMKFKCKECDAMFAKKHLFKRHKKDHSQIFICGTCNNKFTKKDSLIVHMKVHTIQSFKCEECNQNFQTKNYLRLHMRSHQPVLGCKHCPFQTKNSKRFSKHACINKLYDIQERTLNFLQGENNLLEMKTSDIQEGSLHQRTVSKETMHKRTKVSKTMKKSKATMRKLKSRTKMELLDINLKLKSLRQNLPSRRSQDTIKSTGKSDLITCKFKTLHSSENSTLVTSKTCIRKSRLSCELSCKGGSLVNKKPTKIKKKTQKDLKSFGSDGAKWILGGKFTQKELLTEPVMLTNSSFVQCFYQSHSPTSPDHISLHLRQTRLLSCRFCSYKTNSTYLLKQHSANIHAWDPNLVKNLFR